MCRENTQIINSNQRPPAPLWFSLNMNRFFFSPGVLKAVRLRSRGPGVRHITIGWHRLLNQYLVVFLKAVPHFPVLSQEPLWTDDMVEKDRKRKQPGALTPTGQLALQMPVGADSYLSQTLNLTIIWLSDGKEKQKHDTKKLFLFL